MICLGLVAAACTTKEARPVAQTDTTGPALAARDTIPQGPLGDAIRRGRAILVATRDSMPAYVGNDLTCVSCHLDEGTRPYAMPWTGVHARYPQYRSRSASVQTLPDRINDCFERSLAGKAVPERSPEMRAIVAYMAWLSRGIPVGARTPGQGIDSVHVASAVAGRGAQVWAASCARCHGAAGEGVPPVPPVWGSRSFTVGAGMARPRTAASFIRSNMPRDKPGTLSAQEAMDVAAYIGTQNRADFRGKERDWPKGNPPPDVPYRTSAAKPATGG